MDFLIPILASFGLISIIACMCEIVPAIINKAKTPNYIQPDIFTSRKKREKELRRQQNKGVFLKHIFPKLFFFTAHACLFVVLVVPFVVAPNSSVEALNVAEVSISEDTSATPVFVPPSSQFLFAIDEPQPPTVIVEGACVDKAQTILNMLKRRYDGFDQIKCALSYNHVQVVRQNPNSSIDYLDLTNDWQVVVGASEFHGSTIQRIVPPELFLEAISVYKPEIGSDELSVFLDSKLLGNRNR